MEERKRIFLLLVVLAVTALTAVATTIALLYHAALKEQRARLTETAQSQARLIEAVARFDGKYSTGYPGNRFAATLSQVVDAHRQYKGFGKTGEFTLARRDDKDIVFLLSHRHYDLQNPKPVPFHSTLAEPMRRALSGLSGTVVGLDYRGEAVLAAYEPVAELGLGIVAKIDLAEVRAPFIRAGLIAGGTAILVISIGVALFLQVSNPIVQRLQEYSRELEKRVADRTAELVKVNEALEAQIVERKRAEEETHKSKKRFQELWDNAPVAYHTLDSNGVITSVNSTEATMFGYAKEEMVGKPIFQFILPGQQADAESRFRQKLQGKRIPKHENRIYVKKDGTRMYVSIDDVLEFDGRGNVAGVRTTMVDVTQRKKAENALQKSEAQLRRLSSQLLTVQEDERKKIARELHDSIGQSLAAVKFVAESALSQISQHEVTAGTESLKTLIPLVQQAANEVRRIHTDLRPSLLDDLGITSTIAWFCREFEKVYRDISIDRRIEIGEDDIPEPLKIVIFRILQEALNNVSKHGKADSVNVSMGKNDDRLELVIKDNGQGFDVGQARATDGSQARVGLTSMKERTERAGGTWSVESKPEIGTTIRASWPLHR